jgi:hypothetical protein
MHSLTQKFCCVRVDFEGDEVRGYTIDRLLISVVEVGEAEIAVEQAARAAADHLDWGCGQSQLQAIEPIENVAVDIVDAAMRFVGDDKIEEAGVERLTDLHHGGIGRQIDPVLTFVCSGGPNNDRRMRSEVREGILRLLSQFATIAQKQDPLRPVGVGQQLSKPDNDASLPGSRRLDDERLATLAFEFFCHPLDRVRLVEAIDDLPLG